MSTRKFLWPPVHNYREQLVKTSMYVVGVLIFGATGSALLFTSHAATPSVPLEAESGTLSSCASSVADTSASNSHAVKFGGCSTGTMTDNPTNLDSSGATIPDTNYAIPAAAIFMATAGNDSAAGTKDAPVATLNKAISLVSSGGTIVVRAGTYRDWYSNNAGTTYAAITKSITIQPYPHEQVWFDGTDVEAANKWTSDGAGHWYMPWSTPDFCAGNYYLYAYNNQSGSTQNPGNGNTGPCSYYDTYADPANPAAGDPQMVFKNGVYVHEVTSLSAVDSTDFYYQEDTANKTGKLYIGFDPSSATTEVAVRPTALQMSGSNSIVRGIGFKRYATNSFSNATHGAVFVGAPGVTLENVVFAQMAGEGLAAGGNESDTKIIHSVFAFNGYDGLGINGHQHTSGVADNLIIEGSVFNNNNTERFDTGCSASCGAGNLKLAHMDGFTFKNNITENAVGHGVGVWCDLACSGGVIVNNIVRNNGTQGILYEVSDTGIIASNLVYNNSGYGIMSSGANTKIYNNTLVNNTGYGGLWVYDDNRSDGYAGWSDVGPDTVNVSVVNNIIADTKNSNTLLRTQGQVTTQTNTVPSQFFTQLDYNSYYRGSANQFILRWIAPTETDYKSLSAFSNAEAGLGVSGLEAHSTDTTGSSDPFFTDMANNNYTVRSDSVAYHSGTTLPDDVAAALGLSTKTGLSRGAIDWPGK